MCDRPPPRWRATGCGRPRGHWDPGGRPGSDHVAVPRGRDGRFPSGANDSADDSEVQSDYETCVAEVAQKGKHRDRSAPGLGVHGSALELPGHHHDGHSEDKGGKGNLRTDPDSRQDIDRPAEDNEKLRPLK